jgi:hypothetical protein
MNGTTARIYLALLGLILVTVGGISVATPPAALTQVAQTIGATLIILGAIGFALVATFGAPAISGLTNEQQAILTFVAYLATSLGSINVALLSLSGASLWYVSLILAIFGAVGIALKEAIGIVLSVPTP